MNEFLRWSRAATLWLLLWPVGVQATIQLEINPAEYRFGDYAGGGTAQARFDILVTGLTDGVAVAAYDFGLIYDPAIMTLAAAGFLGFTDRLGDPGQGQVLNADHRDPGNAGWDYRADHPSFGAYTGRLLGSPTNNGQFIEGSLRFTQVSLLGRDALLALQDYSATSSLLLFSLLFDVNTTGHKTGTRLTFVDDRDYAGWTGAPDAGLLDVKLSTETDPVAELSSYLPRDDGSVWVPAPAGSGLLLSGLALLALLRRRGRQPA